MGCPVPLKRSETLDLLDRRIDGLKRFPLLSDDLKGFLDALGALVRDQETRISKLERELDAFLAGYSLGDVL